MGEGNPEAIIVPFSMLPDLGVYSHVTQHRLPICRHTKEPAPILESFFVIDILLCIVNSVNLLFIMSNKGCPVQASLVHLTEEQHLQRVIPRNAVHCQIVLLLELLNCLYSG